MNLLFCDNPFAVKSSVDTDYEAELQAAEHQGFHTHLFSYEALTRESDALFATRRIKQSDTLQKIMYRGWMLKPKQYTLLHNVLLAKNYQLLNSPTQYQNCHYFPDGYGFIKAHTPKTVWLKVENLKVNETLLRELIAPFGSAPLLLKDFVKSQKHYWDTACFIPAASDLDKVNSVIHKFLELQGTDLNEGLVFREFVELADLTIHSKSGMPLKEEYRLFFGNGQLLGIYNYWEEGDYAASEPPPLNLFAGIAKGVRSNFFSMDIAKTKGGEWIIIELGDGQVSGLPDKADPFMFYEQVGKHFG